MGAITWNEVQGCSTLILGAIALYVAWQQWRTNRNKVRLDLYERRFAVYTGLMELLAAAVGRAAVSNQELFAYRSRTSASSFLFGTEVSEYLDAVWKRAVEVESVRMQLDAQSSPIGSQRTELAGRLSDSLGWLAQQLNASHRVFYPYLGFKE